MDPRQFNMLQLSTGKSPWLNDSDLELAQRATVESGLKPQNHLLISPLKLRGPHCPSAKSCSVPPGSFGRLALSLVGPHIGLPYNGFDSLKNENKKTHTKLVVASCRNTKLTTSGKNYRHEGENALEFDLATGEWAFRQIGKQIRSFSPGAGPWRHKNLGGRGHGMGDRLGFFDPWSGMIDYQWRSVMRLLRAVDFTLKCLFQTIFGGWVGRLLGADLDSLGVAHGSPRCHWSHCTWSHDEAEIPGAPKWNRFFKMVSGPKIRIEK